jgi:single-strand DNA-binding protein
MAILNSKTIVGNIGSVYEKRTVGAENRSVIDFTVAVTPRERDGDGWKDGTTSWNNVTVWGKLADNVADSVRAGDRVIVHGREETKAPYKKKDDTMSDAKVVIVADFVGLELGMHSASSNRVPGAKSGASAPAAAKKAPAAKKAAAPASDDLGSFDDDDDLGF